MAIDEIRKALADKLSSSEMTGEWLEILGDTDPGHYGIEDISADVPWGDIWVDIPKKTFTFKNASLSFSARLGGSSEESGFDQDFSVTVFGTGEFEFLPDGRGDVEIKQFSTEGTISLYADE